MLNSPVKVREIKPTSNPEMKVVVFEQHVAKPVTDMHSLLNFANAGNSAFGTNTQKRIAFFNFSPQMIRDLGFIVGQPIRAELQAKLVVHEFCEGDQIPEEVRNYYPLKDKTFAEYYAPRQWKENEGTPQEVTRRKEPKMTWKTDDVPQEVLTLGGRPIYRETHFAMLDMIKADILLKHDNKITGSSNAIRTHRVGQPTSMPELS